MTNKEAVSKVVNQFRLANKDNHRSRRYILKVLQDIAATLISQKNLDRTLSSETNLYSEIPCFEFKKIESKSCLAIDFRLCDVLMKSKKPLPKLVFSRLGASIKEIVSLDGNYTFVFLEKGQYQRNKKRKHSIKGEVYIYLGSDMHLYIPDEEIYSLDLTIITLNTYDVDNCSSCKEKNCKSNWDYEFIVPDKLVTTMYQMAYQELGINRQIVEDQNPNNIEGV